MHSLGFAKPLQNFIADVGLKEFNQGGKKYTYMCDDGIKLSKLDRFLVCLNFITQQPLTTVIALPRQHSDHSPWSLNLQTKILDHPLSFLQLLDPQRRL